MKLFRDGMLENISQLVTVGRENDHKKKEIITMQYICKKVTSTIQSKQQIPYTGEDHFENNDLGDFIHATLTYKGKKPYEDKQFQKNFNYHSFISQHKQIHTGHKSYDCHLHGNNFRSNSVLREHEKMHTGEKSYGYHL
ncbi:zinc finger protein 596-like [Choloepus didactylus]|uniref:zinc finger protein 596-like n=1 Tax=Choloepus didactylus TaxID=27675 RepID=UPI00189D8573|nr:zinc finger protein 596-like [Choloepus didactylus]